MKKKLDRLGDPIQRKKIVGWFSFKVLGGWRGCLDSLEASLKLKRANALDSDYFYNWPNLSNTSNSKFEVKRLKSYSWQLPGWLEQWHVRVPFFGKKDIYGIDQDIWPYYLTKDTMDIKIQ